MPDHIFSAKFPKFENLSFYPFRCILSSKVKIWGLDQCVEKVLAKIWILEYVFSPKLEVVGLGRVGGVG